MYDPAEILRDAGFKNVTAKIFPSEERFSPQDALRHIQSAGVWNEIPAKKEAEAIQLMRDYIAIHTENGKANRELEVVIVRGMKS